MMPKWDDAQEAFWGGLVTGLLAGAVIVVCVWALAVTR